LNEILTIAIEFVDLSAAKVRNSQEIRASNSHDLYRVQSRGSWLSEPFFALESTARRTARVSAVLLSAFDLCSPELQVGEAASSPELRAVQIQVGELCVERKLQGIFMRRVFQFRGVSGPSIVQSRLESVREPETL